MKRSPGLVLFRLLVRLYPRDFRREYGDDLEAFFRRELETSRRLGEGRARFWMRTLADIVEASARLRIGAVAGSRRVVPGRRDGGRRGREGRGVDVVRDLRYGLRSLRRHPRYSVVAVVTLALGVGATTSFFSVMDAVLLRPLPYPEAERLTLVGTHIRNGGPELTPVSSEDFLALTRAPGAFERLVAVDGDPAVLEDVEGAERLPTARVSGAFFDVFGGRPAVGRILGPEDDRDPRVAVLDHGFWMDRFGGDPGVVGRHLTLDGERVRVVGVVGEAFLPPEALPASDAVLWRPLGLSLKEPDGKLGLVVVGRRLEGASLADADRGVRRFFEEAHGTGDGTDIAR